MRTGRPPMRRTVLCVACGHARSAHRKAKRCQHVGPRGGRTCRCRLTQAQVQARSSGAPLDRWAMLTAGERAGGVAHG